MIQVEELTKDYGPRRAIDRISFHAEKGEILGFLGPNGAGKTTTMRILCGYMPPTMGKASIAGFDVIDKSLEVRKRVGYLPESVPLYPDMTIFEYLKFMADLRHIRNSEDRVDAVLESVHMEDRSESYISSLSKGMRQRVGLAQALLHEPDVLILDEPTIGLDPAQIREVRNMIRNIGEEHTVLLSTHILSEAQQMCDRVLIINKGKIVAEDSPEQLQLRLAGAQNVAVQVVGDDKEAEKIIASVTGVIKVEKTADGQYQFETSPGQDVRPSVARNLIEHGIDLLEMRPMGLSLEDIFLELTRDQPADFAEMEQEDMDVSEPLEEEIQDA